MLLPGAKVVLNKSAILVNSIGSTHSVVHTVFVSNKSQINEPTQLFDENVELNIPN